MARRPRLSGWSSKEQLERERERRKARREAVGLPPVPEIRRPGRAVKAFGRYGFSQDEAEKLVHEHFLKPSSVQGRRFCKQRRQEVEFYMRELGLTWDEAVARASELREEIAMFVESPTGAFADALKWSTKFVTKRIIWGKEPLSAVVERFREAYHPQLKSIEEYA